MVRSTHAVLHHASASTAAGVGAAAWGRLQRRPFHGSARALGIFNALRNQWNQSKEDYMGQKKDELFQEQIAFLVKKEKYTLIDFYEGFKVGMDGWRKHVPGVKSDPACEEMQMSMAILNAIPQELKDNPVKVKAEAKVKIAKESGRTVTEINKILGHYEEAKMLHGWLRKRIEMNKPLPRTPDDVIKIREEEEVFQKQTQPLRKGFKKGGLMYK